MVTKYVEIAKARLAIGAEDATYGVQFDYETLYGKTWEFDPNSDAVGQYTSRRTGKIRVSFNPVKNTMAFPEDATRRTQYVMSIEDARTIWKFLATKTPHFWFALDVAFEAELKGVDSDICKMLMGCEGYATEVTPA